MVTEHPNDPLSQFRSQDLDAALADASLKQAVVTPMFDVIAPRYDAFTRLFSFGMDASWKADLMRRVVSRANTATRALDVACGTGDLAFALAQQVPRVHVTGVDPSSQMLSIANRRAADQHNMRVSFQQGDFAALPAADASIDVLTAGYGFRNVPDLDAAVRECARVIRPGGTLGSLDFFRPANAVWRALFLWYLRASGNLVGWWWHRTPSIYGYIARSIELFVSADQFAQVLGRHGFRVIESKRMLLGGTALHIAVREGTP